MWRIHGKTESSGQFKQSQKGPFALDRSFKAQVCREGTRVYMEAEKDQAGPGAAKEQTGPVNQTVRDTGCY